MDNLTDYDRVRTEIDLENYTEALEMLNNIIADAERSLEIEQFVPVRMTMNLQEYYNTKGMLYSRLGDFHRAFISYKKSFEYNLEVHPEGNQYMVQRLESMYNHAQRINLATDELRKLEDKIRFYAEKTGMSTPLKIGIDNDESYNEKTVNELKQNAENISLNFGTNGTRYFNACLAIASYNWSFGKWSDAIDYYQECLNVDPKKLINADEERFTLLVFRFSSIIRNNIKILHTLIDEGSTPDKINELKSETLTVELEELEALKSYVETDPQLRESEIYIILMESVFLMWHSKEAYDNSAEILPAWYMTCLQHKDSSFAQIDFCRNLISDYQQNLPKEITNPMMTQIEEGEEMDLVLGELKALDFLKNAADARQVKVKPEGDTTKNSERVEINVRTLDKRRFWFFKSPDDITEILKSKAEEEHAIIHVLSSKKKDLPDIVLAGLNDQQLFETLILTTIQDGITATAFAIIANDHPRLFNKLIKKKLSKPVLFELITWTNGDGNNPALASLMYSKNYSLVQLILERLDNHDKVRLFQSPIALGVPLSFDLAGKRLLSDFSDSLVSLSESQLFNLLLTKHSFEGTEIRLIDVVRMYACEDKYQLFETLVSAIKDIGKRSALLMNLSETEEDFNLRVLDPIFHCLGEDDGKELISRIIP